MLPLEEAEEEEKTKIQRSRKSNKLFFSQYHKEEMTDLKNEKCSLSTIPIKSQVSNQARKFDQLLIASPSLLSSVFAEIQELRRETEERIDALTRDCEFHQQSSKLEKLKTKEGTCLRTN